MTFLKLPVILAVTIILPVRAVAEPLHGDEEQRQAVASGWRAYQQGDMEQAFIAYQRAVTLIPNDASLWYDLGCLHVHRHEPDAARTAFHKALSLDLRFAPASAALGQLAEEDGRLSNAKEFYTHAVRQQPSNTTFLYLLLRTQLMLEDPSAKQTADALLALAPADLDTRYTLGVLALHAQQLELAIYHFQGVLVRAPNHLMAWNGLGLSYAGMNVWDEALKALEHAKSLDPNNPKTLTNLGLVAAKQQRWQEARLAWQQALQMDPSFAPAAKNLEALEMLTVQGAL